MAIDISPIVEEFREFFHSVLPEEINNLSENYPERRSLSISYSSLERFSPSLADELLQNPDTVIRAAEEAVRDVPLISQKEFKPHVRFYELPKSSQVLVQDIGAAHIGKLISVDCVVTKRTEIHPKVKVVVLRCKLCDARYKTPLGENAVVPETCEHCRKRTLVQSEDESFFVDLQKAEAQEPLEVLRGGAPATRIELWVEDDLVNTFFPGQRVVITGILRIRPPPPSRGRKSPIKYVYNKYLDVVHIKKVEKEFEEVDISSREKEEIMKLSKDPRIYDKIVSSIAPSIYGHDEVKEALALQLFGGTPGKYTTDGGRIRSDIHVLLIGEPGVAKTRLLQYVAHLAPKSIYVSGKSVTGTGLTAAAERDELGDGGWTLKAGALVLASGGIASIDEFDKISDTEKAAMHEVMESQSISVAKAGIVARFAARTSILAAANPKYGRFDPHQYPADQFDIPPTILSRFDLIFPIKDVLDEEKDKRLAEHILIQHTVAGMKDKGIEENVRIAEPPLNTELLRKYIAYARKYVKPVLTKEAREKLKEYYVELRKLGQQEGAVPITPRQIEALIRLSEASAKTRLSDRVELMDAERAIKLLDFVLRSTMLDKSTGRIDIDIITTGQPKSRMDKVKAVLDIIKRLSEEDERGMVSIEKVVQEAASQGIGETECRRFINNLEYQLSEIYEPKPGFIKPVRRKVE